MMRLADMRILMTADTIGGVWTYATGLASTLAALGANVHLVSMGRRLRDDQREMLAHSRVHLIESDLALEWQDPEGTDVVHARDVLAGLERPIAPDVVHLNSYREATFGWRAPVVVTAHSCANSWAIACNDSAWLSEPRWRRYSECVAAGLNKADAWVAPTRAFRDVMDHLYEPRTAGHVIWNGSAGPNDPAIAKSPFILTAGRMWDTAKNLALLSKIAADLDWPIVVAGAAANSAEPSARNLEFMGEIPHAELGARMQCAAIFVSPALYEPFGLSVLEAARRGCALVLSDIPTFRELWDGCASFVDPGDSDGLRRALTDLCTDAAVREKLQRAALACSRRYTMTRLVDRYEQLYRSLMPPRKASRSAVEVCA